MPKRNRVARELRVVFDTNALHTQLPSDLVNADTRELIRTNSDHSDLTVTWHLPEIVIMERQYQMLQKADQLLRNFQKMDSILGLSIALTSEQLSPKIESVIAAQMAEMRIQRLTVDPTQVKWPELIRKSALRIAPFQGGETEKGFRDAIILESFIQLVEDAPKSAATCRLVLVTNDGRLTEAAQARLESYANAEVLPGLEEVRNLINTLISTVGESYVKELREKAAKLFFEKDDNDTLIYREKIVARINVEFAKELSELPAGAEMRDRGTVIVGTPRFIRKERQRVHWLTQLEFTTSAYRYEAPKPSQTATVTGATLSSLMTNPSPGLGGNLLSALPDYTGYNFLGGSQREQILLKKGHTDFNVAWSTTVDRHAKLTRPKIDGISAVGTTWE